MADDIVTRLRKIAESWLQVCWAADEIERLEVCEAADEIERLRAERDEARRSYCFVAHCHNETPSAVAKRHGWDCFKGDADAR